MAEELAQHTTVKNLKTGLCEGADEILNVIFDVLVPIIVLIAGFFLTDMLGLSGAFHQLFTAADIKGFSGTILEGNVDGLLAAIIWGAVAYSVWKTQEHKKDGVRWILRPIAAFFGGLALGELFNGLTAHIGYGEQLIGNAVKELVTAVEGA